MVCSHLAYSFIYLFHPIAPDHLEWTNVVLTS